jgi:hypothetical protein
VGAGGPVERHAQITRAGFLLCEGGRRTGRPREADEHGGDEDEAVAAS